MMWSIHLYMQFGCLALDEIIQVSDQPVAPSLGLVVSTLIFLSALMTLAWYCHAVPIAMSPPSKPVISSVEVPQYLLTSSFWVFSSATAAASCLSSSAYGFLMPRSGWVAIRYSAASAT